MEGVIVNYRTGRHTQYDNQMIISVLELTNREEAAKHVGKKVTYVVTESGKELIGEVRSAHGNSGALRVLFETGMPGQSKGQKVSIK